MEPDGAGAGPVMTGVVMPSMPAMARVVVDLGFMVRTLRATLEYMRGSRVVVPASTFAPRVPASVHPRRPGPARRPRAAGVRGPGPDGGARPSRLPRHAARLARR